MKILIPLAEGFEEIEAVTTIDVLRRAELNVTTAFLKDNPVTGAHSISIMADKGIKEITDDEFDSIILPGGMPGSENLKNNDSILNLLKKINSRNGLIGAICAAPMVPGSIGLLYGKKATCFPGFEEYLEGAEISDESVVRDGNIITGKGAGLALDFALEIVAALKNEPAKIALRKSMQVNK